jgi:hypothetical protein
MYEKFDDAIGVILAVNQRMTDNIMAPHPYDNSYFSH